MKMLVVGSPSPFPKEVRKFQDDAADRSKHWDPLSLGLWCSRFWARLWRGHAGVENSYSYIAPVTEFRASGFIGPRVEGSQFWIRSKMCGFEVSDLGLWAARVVLMAARLPSDLSRSRQTAILTRHIPNHHSPEPQRNSTPRREHTGFTKRAWAYEFCIARNATKNNKKNQTRQ